jgi:hypothetical protein
MDAFSLAVLVFVGGLVGTLTVDVGLNAVQNWYDQIYLDAYWSHHPVDTPVMQQLAREEAEIDRLMRTPNFAAPARDER